MGTDPLKAIDAELRRAQELRDAGKLHLMPYVMALRTIPEGLRPPQGVDYADWEPAVKATRRMQALLSKRPDNPKKLWAIQGWVLSEMERVRDTSPARGSMVGLGVGEGKTWVSFLAGQVFQVSRSLVVTENRLMRKTYEEFDELAEHFYAPMPHVTSYYALSVDRDDRILNDFQPQLIILDEAHHLRHGKSSRNRRLMRYLQSRPTTRVVTMTATLFRRNIEDAYWLLYLALRSYNPIPPKHNTRAALGAVMDAIKADPPPEAAVTCRPFIDAYGTWTGDVRYDMRRAFQARLDTIPGVTLSRAPRIPVNITMVRWRTKRTPEVKEALRNLSNSWELPDGTRLTDAKDYARHANTLSLGFYYRYEWGSTPEPIVAAYEEARLNWTKAIDGYLSNTNIKGSDSRLLVCQKLDGGRGPRSLRQVYRTWNHWRERQKPPVRHTVWVDDGAMLQRVVDGAQALYDEPILLWYKSKGVEAKLRELGVPVGDGGADPRFEDGTVALSQRKYGTGRNLPAFGVSFLIEPLRPGDAMEQLIGRTHREGQERDNVDVVVNTTTHYQHATLAKCIQDARFQQDVTRTAQRLLMASWATTITHKPGT